MSEHLTRVEHGLAEQAIALGALSRLGLSAVCDGASYRFSYAKSPRLLRPQFLVALHWAKNTPTPSPIGDGVHPRCHRCAG